MNKLISQLGLGGLIGLIGGLGGVIIGGIAVFMANPMGGLIYIVISVLFFGLFWKVMFKPMWQNAHILEVGVPGQAKILAIAENGSSIRVNGSMPKAGVNLTLEVHPQDKAIYQTTIKTYISVFELQKFQVGQFIDVKIDPEHPELLAVVDVTQPLGGYAATDTDPAQAALKAELTQFASKQQHLFQIGVEAKGIVQRMQELPARVNGDNPVLALAVEVQPLNQPSYQAETKMVTARTAVGKFQPGMEVTVKYDPENPNDIAIFHSGSPTTPTMIK